MSQRDLTAELRGARIAAPSELRERVRLIAAADTTPTPRGFTWRRALVVAAPGRSGRRREHRLHPARRAPGRRHGDHDAGRPRRSARRPAAGREGHRRPDGLGRAGAPQSSPCRARRIACRSTARTSHCASRARRPSPTASRAHCAIASSLGGYPASVHASSEAKVASADLVLKIPRAHVQEAITRLSALGTITGEQVDIQDTGRAQRDRPEIARLQSSSSAARADADDDDVQAHIAALEAQIERLQREQAATRRAAHYATVHLHLRRRSGRAPNSKVTARCTALVVAFTWLGIGAVYALAIGTPLRAARAARLARRPRRCAGAARYALLDSSDLIRAKTRNVGSPTGSSSNSGLMQPSSSSRDS